MPIIPNETSLTLSGVVSVEEAQPLHEWLLAHPTGAINLEGVLHLHTAALQVLIAAKPRIERPIQDEFLASTLLPFL